MGPYVIDIIDIFGIFDVFGFCDVSYAFVVVFVLPAFGWFHCPLRIRLKIHDFVFKCIEIHEFMHKRT